MQWDYTVNQSINSSIFGFSWYLDALNKDWYGLITESYNHIMPVIFHHSHTKRIVDNTKILPFHPIYSRKTLSKDVNTHFLIHLKRIANYLHISLDKMVQFYDYAKLHTYRTPLFEIDLITTYQRKRSLFNDKVIQCLDHLGANGYTVRKEQDENKALSMLYGSTLRLQVSHPFSRSQLRKLTSKMRHYHLASFYGLYSPKGHCIAMVMFIRSQNHYQLLALSISRFRKKLALMTMIIDHFLQVNSEKPLTLCLDNLVGPNAPTVLTALGAKHINQTIVKHGIRSWFPRIKTP